MNCEEANNISIIGFLNSLGIQPARVSANSYWYLSPLRNEKTPSFKVNPVTNRWYDHGISSGGKLVDLGVKILNIDVSDFLSKLADNDPKSFSFQKPEAIDEVKLEIRKIKPLENTALTSYLKERGISLSIAREFCQEVYYQIKDKNYFAICFKNDSDGLELRNKYMKLCLNKKDITSFIQPDSKKVVMFEGFMDFLTWLKISEPKMGPELKKLSFIVLNSVNQIESAKVKLLSVPGISIEAYFDNDDAGRKCFESLKKDFPSALDKSDLYKGHKDLNEMISKDMIVSKTKWNSHDELSM